MEPRVGATLLVAGLSLGCHAFEAAPPSDVRALPSHPLELPDGVEIEGGWVEPSKEADARVLVTIVNATSDTLEFMRGQCFSRLRAFSSEDLEEPAVWDDHREELSYCPDVGYQHRLEPSARDTLAQLIHAGSWPPPRGSHLGIVLEVNGSRMIIPVRRR